MSETDNTANKTVEEKRPVGIRERARRHKTKGPAGIRKGPVGIKLKPTKGTQDNH